jgi:hypothetical protein
LAAAYLFLMAGYVVVFLFRPDPLTLILALIAGVATSYWLWVEWNRRRSVPR